MLILTPLLASSCSDDSSGQKVDHGGELQSGSETGTDDAIPPAEVDSIIGRYFSATDSLATLFDSISTVDDVEASAGEIARINEDIWEFNRLSVQYGQVLLDRMDQVDQGASLERLLNARQRLQGMPEVYARVEAIEKEIPGRNEGVEDTVANSAGVTGE
jgi:hypothetical protein